MSQFRFDELLMQLPPINKTLSGISRAAAPFVEAHLVPYATVFVSSPWLCFGIGPLLSVFLSMMISCTILELLAAQPFMEKYLITYSARESRRAQVTATQEKVRWWDQFARTLLEVGGPMNVFGCVAQRYLLEFLLGGLPATPLPTLAAFLIDFSLLALLADLGLYWGHRIQHLNSFLWHRCHSFHHKLVTPTAFSTAYIDPGDTLLQAALPLILAQAVVRAHPVTHCAYLAFHIANNALNHSGIHAWWLDVLTLKFLPLRCDNRLHDAHHRFSGFGKGAKNFGEMFWLWDWVFGTLSQTAEVMTRHRAKD